MTDELDNGRALPEMEGGWDQFFDDTSLRTYVPGLETTAEEETRAAVELAEVESGAANLCDRNTSSPMKSSFCRHFAPDVWATGLGQEEVLICRRFERRERRDSNPRPPA